MYARDVFAKNRVEYEKKIIEINESENVVSTDFGVEDGFFWYRAWCI
jgi:hypothetical protein